MCCFYKDLVVREKGEVCVVEMMKKGRMEEIEMDRVVPVVPVVERGERGDKTNKTNKTNKIDKRDKRERGEVRHVLTSVCGGGEEGDEIVMLEKALWYKYGGKSVF